MKSLQLLQRTMIWSLSPHFLLLKLFSKLCFLSFFSRQKCLRKALKKCLKRCSSNVEKCLKRVIRKYDPDEEEVCFPSKQLKQPFLSLSCYSAALTAKPVLNRGALNTRWVAAKESRTRCKRRCSCPGRGGGVGGGGQSNSYELRKWVLVPYKVFSLTR